MDIFFIDMDKVKDFSFLKKYEEETFNCEKRRRQRAFGRFLVKSAAEKIYNIKDTEVIFKNKKPVFRGGELNFSISHSKNIVLAALGKCSVGVDIEYIQPRDFEKILRRYEVQISDLTPEKFYKFWTVYEAKIKLQECEKSLVSYRFSDDFVLSIASAEGIDFEKEINVHEIICTQSFKTMSLGNFHSNII